jgi:excisionase family DNA binding protein
MTDVQTTTQLPATARPETSSEALEVLTLAEAAAYLRVSEEALLGEIGPQAVPVRRIGDEWRFLKSALNEWLSTSKPSAKEAMLRMAGQFQDDPYLDEIVREAYEKRGRPMTEKAG